MPPLPALPPWPGMRAGRIRPGWSLALVLLVLAAAVRQNGVVLLPVAAVTLAVMAPGRWRQGAGFSWRRDWCCCWASSASLAPRSDGGDGAAAEVRLAQSYDLAGAFARAPDLTLSLTPELDRLLRGPGARLYTPLRNDPFAADPALTQARADAPDGVISGAWQALVTQHPLLYLSVRWADFAAVLTTPDSEICHLAMTGVTGPPDLLRQAGPCHPRSQPGPGAQGLCPAVLCHAGILPPRMGPSGPRAADPAAAPPRRCGLGRGRPAGGRPALHPELLLHLHRLRLSLSFVSRSRCHGGVALRDYKKMTIFSAVSGAFFRTRHFHMAAE